MRIVQRGGLALLAAVALWTGAAGPVAAAELKVLLPLGRTAYQTNERIDVAVVRSAAEALAAGDLALALDGDDGSRLAFTFAVPAAAPLDGKALRTEHLYLDGRLLRPGRYALRVAADGAQATAAIEVFSHVRRTDYRLIYWSQGGDEGLPQQMMGEDGMGFNVFWGQGRSWTEHLIRGGIDYMQCCTMSGGHQMDLRQECDWSDPYVLAGGVARVARQALVDRTRSNVIGVHFYDEPGLTWWKHPRTGQEVPHNIPSQDRAFLSAFGREAPPYDRMQAGDPASLTSWMHLGRWKLGFMEAAWKLARFGVEYVRPDYLSGTQGVYGWNAFSDGYYFNTLRSLPILCGHGGYDLWGPGWYHPSLTMAMGRVRDLQRPAWYLPAWDAETTDRLRMEQYLSFAMNLQGMMIPPPIKVSRPWAEPCTDGAVESNLLMGRLGTIFSTMPVTRPPAAVLYSLSQNLLVQSRLMQKPHDEAAPGNYGHAQFAQLIALYLAHAQGQFDFFPIVEEDVVDGTLAAHHKVLVLPTVEYLPSEVVAGIEAFIAGGGTVYASDDGTVAIKGARKLGVAVPVVKAEPDKMVELLAACKPLTEALAARYKESGVMPVFETASPGVVGMRQAWGDVEYLFAISAACDTARGGYNPVRPVAAAIRLPNDGRPVYDAVHAGPAAAFKAKGKQLVGEFRFGTGQMRVFARTDRPIGGVQVSVAGVRRDYTDAASPLRAEVAATVVDADGRPIAGSLPLEVRLVDPLGETRYRLYRATDRGTLRLALPLAANDPPGQWKVVVRELLAGRAGEQAFALASPAQCGAAAGAAHRAVTFGRDRENVFRFFRVHQDVTIVKGTSDFHAAAADRLAKALAPWGIRTKIVAAADVNKPRQVPEDGQKTWVGVDFGRLDPAKPAIGHTGFALDGPAIVLGTPDDNPLVKFLKEKDYLPYAPAKDEFPGRGRGLMAWQSDGIGWGGQESITLIAYDEAGMAEAVGTLYEAASGLDPLTPWAPPAASVVTAAAKPPARAPEAKVAWRLAMPDGAVAVRPLGKDRVAVLTKDGTLAALDAAGKEAWRREIDGGEDWSLDVAADGKTLTVGATHRRLTFDAGGKPRGEEPIRLPEKWQKPAPPPKPAVALPKMTAILAVDVGEGAVVAAAEEGAVVHLKSRTGKLEEQIAWQYKQPGRTVKRIAVAGGRTAVAYWGGTVHVLDAEGKIATAQRLDQDVADMAWLGGRLVVGLADGTVLGLDAK